MTTDALLHIVLNGWQPPVQKIAVVRVLRQHASLSLTEATRAIDQCLRGEAVSLAMPSLPAAQAVVDAISGLGICTEIQHPISTRSGV